MLGLYTEPRELRTAACYLQRGMAGPATFSLFARSLPPHHGFLVTAGLADVLKFLEEFHLDDAGLDYLRAIACLPDDAVDALRGLRFTGDVWAMPEGRVAFAGEPLLEVTAPIAEAQAVKSAMLGIVTYQTAMASKAAHRRLSARKRQLAAIRNAPDIPLRRAPSPEVGWTCASSPIWPSRTHRWGVYSIDPETGVAADAPYLEIACGLVAYDDQPVMKLSAGRATLPGAKQVFRDEHGGEDILALRGEPTPARHTPLLEPVMTAGKRNVDGDEHGRADEVAAANRRFEADLSRLPEQTRRLDKPVPIVPAVSVALRRLHDELHEYLLCRQLLYHQLLDRHVVEQRAILRRPLAHEHALVS